MSLCINKLFIIICRQIENASHWAFFWRMKIVVNLSITCSMIPKALDHYSCALVHAALFKRESPLTFWSDPYRAISESHGAGIKGGSLLLNSLMLWKQRWWKVCSAQRAAGRQYGCTGPIWASDRMSNEAASSVRVLHMLWNIPPLCLSAKVCANHNVSVCDWSWQKVGTTPCMCPSDLFVVVFSLYLFRKHCVYSLCVCVQ